MEITGLNKRIEVYSKTTTYTASGAESFSYTKTIETYAQVVRRSGQMREMMATRFEDYTLELNVRIQHSIKEEDRIVLKGETKKYVVVSVIPNRDAMYNTLICLAVKN